MKEKAEIRKYVQSLLTNNGDEGPLADQDSLLLSGRLQTRDVAEIILFLEENFGINFEQFGFDTNQIDTIGAIYELTQTYRKWHLKQAGWRILKA